MLFKLKSPHLLIVLCLIAFLGGAYLTWSITINTSITSNAKINACTNVAYSATGGTQYCPAGYYVVGAINNLTNRQLMDPGSPPTSGYMVCCMNLD